MHSLTDTKVRSLTPSQKTQRHFDGGGLYLEVSPAGGKWWRFKYRLLGVSVPQTHLSSCR